MIKSNSQFLGFIILILIIPFLSNDSIKLSISSFFIPLKLQFIIFNEHPKSIDWEILFNKLFDMILLPKIIRLLSFVWEMKFSNNFMLILFNIENIFIFFTFLGINCSNKFFKNFSDISSSKNKFSIFLKQYFDKFTSILIEILLNFNVSIFLWNWIFSIK